jgi:hypothetical protein
LDSMQGEGDLISHLGKSGYYVSHIQVKSCISLLDCQLS